MGAPRPALQRHALPPGRDEPWRGTGPEEVGEVVAGEPFSGLEGEPDEEREVLARAEPHLLARSREQGGAAETIQLKGVDHRDHPRFLDTRVVLGGRINDVSTR